MKTHEVEEALASIVEATTDDDIGLRIDADFLGEVPGVGVVAPIRMQAHAEIVRVHHAHRDLQSVAVY